MEGTLEVGNLVEGNPAVGTLVVGMHLLGNLLADILQKFKTPSDLVIKKTYKNINFTKIKSEKKELK